MLLVSHDRAFLNNVVTSSLVFENGNVKEFVGGYDNWLQQRAHPKPVAGTAGVNKPTKQKQKPENEQPRKLKYREQQELARLPEIIESLEAEIASIHSAMADPAFYQQTGEAISDEQLRLKDLEESLARSYQRWEELELLRA